MGSGARAEAWEKGLFLLSRVFAAVPWATPPSPNCVRAQRTMPSLLGERMLVEGKGCPVSTPPQPPGLWPRREDKSPCVRAWELSFLPHSSSYQILPYSGNSMGNESTQESGLAPERKVNITKRKSLPILESMCSQE